MKTRKQDKPEAKELRGRDGFARPDPLQPQRWKLTWTASLCGLALLSCGATFYLVNRPDPPTTVARKSVARTPPSQDQLVTYIEELKSKVRMNPGDGMAWYALGRSYQLRRQVGPAAEAYGNAAALMPNDPNVLVDYADTLAATDSRGSGGRPAELVQKALQLEPNHQKGLAFAGTAAFNAGNYPLAITYFQRLQKTFPPDSENARSVAATIAKARAAVAHGAAVVPASVTK